MFLLEAGVSVERLAKAALVRVHPTLLTEVKGNDDMLLHFAGATTTVPRRFHTIGASTAVGRLRKMDILPRSDEFDGLIELRNGVAHLGTSNAEDYLGTFVETVCTLLDHTGQDRTAFWEAWSDLVQVTLDDRSDRVHKAVQLRVNQARYRFRARFADLPEDAVDGVVQAVGEKGLIVVGVGRTGAVFRTLSKCPACEAEAAALFLEAPADSLLFEMELTAAGLRCGLCGFHLTGEQEIKAVGLPSRVRYAVEDLTRVMHDSTLTATDAVLLGSLPVAQPTNWRDSW